MEGLIKLSIQLPPYVAENDNQEKEDDNEDHKSDNEDHPNTEIVATPFYNECNY